MKITAGLALTAIALSMFAAGVYAADESPVSGYWATDRVLDVDMPQGPSMFAKMAASAVNGGNTSSSIGNSSGTPTFTGPTVNTRRPTSNAPRRPGGPNPSGASSGDATEDDDVTAELVNESEPPIILELKVDSKGKLTGKVTEITMIPFARKDLKVEEGTANDKTFEFRTIEKNEKVSNTTRWVGEVTDDKTIKLTRMTKGGNPIDGGVIVFHRAKK